MPLPARPAPHPRSAPKPPKHPHSHASALRGIQRLLGANSVHLERKLVDKRVFPAIDIDKSGALRAYVNQDQTDVFEPRCRPDWASSWRFPPGSVTAIELDADVRIDAATLAENA